MENENMEQKDVVEEKETQTDSKKEEYATVLDYLPYGYPLEGKMIPMVQAIGKKNLTLLQIVPRRGMSFELKEDVYIGDGKRDKVQYILGRLPRKRLQKQQNWS